MSELGELLKKARLEQGLSLDDVQEQTKIRKRYLEALEAGDYSVLPGKFYIRAFIKNYAECVGLDAEEVLRHYKVEVPETEIIETESLPARKPKRMRSSTSERFGKIGFNLLLWGFLILIAFVIWYFTLKSDSNPANEPDDTQITERNEPSATPTPTVIVTPSPTPTVAPVTLTSAPKTGREDIFVVSPSKPSYELTVTNSNSNSWLEIYEGGKNGTKIYYAEIKVGDTETFTVSKDVYLVLGRPGNLEVKLDGILVEDGDSNKGSKRVILQMEESTTTAQ